MKKKDRKSNLTQPTRAIDIDPVVNIIRAGDLRADRQDDRGELSGATDSKPDGDSDWRPYSWPRGAVRVVSFCYTDLELMRNVVTGKVGKEILERLPPVACLEPFAQFLGGLFVWSTEVFKEADLVIDPWTVSAIEGHHDLQGKLFSVCCSFRTNEVGCWFENDYRIGHVYRRVQGVKLELFIDPRWVMPGHGLNKLRAGSTTFAGIFFIEGVDVDKRTVYGRPVVLGDPMYPFDAAITGRKGYQICRSGN